MAARHLTSAIHKNRHCISQLIETDWNNFFPCRRTIDFNDIIDLCRRFLFEMMNFSHIFYQVLWSYHVSFLMMLCNTIFEETRVLLTNCTLNSILTTSNKQCRVQLEVSNASELNKLFILSLFSFITLFYFVDWPKMFRQNIECNF